MNALTKGISHKRRERASIRIATQILRDEGFTILDTGLKVKRNDREIGEIDILARDSSGECWAVEVKSGYADINGVRQAYVNSLLVKCHPMLVARTYSNDDVLELAKELGVELRFLDDLYLSDPIELKVIMEESLSHIWSRQMSLLECARELSPRAMLTIRALAGNPKSVDYNSIIELIDEELCLKDFITDRYTAAFISRYIIEHTHSGY
ncbi:MAG: endonuclease NucS [Desulfurococcales archaeon]|nr:endonuclease NucS [Desulfurococcales archaeon]